MMRGYVPLGALGPTLILITEFTGFPPSKFGFGFGAGGVNVTVTSDGNTPPGAAVMLRLMLLLNDPMESSVTIAVLDSVLLILREVGETEIVKSSRAFVTVRFARADFTIGGVDVSRPVKFSRYVPAGVFTEVLTVHVDDAVPPGGG
jgi:hypothetical protein